MKKLIGNLDSKSVISVCQNVLVQSLGYCRLPHLPSELPDIKVYPTIRPFPMLVAMQLVVGDFLSNLV